MCGKFLSRCGLNQAGPAPYTDFGAAELTTDERLKREKSGIRSGPHPEVMGTLHVITQSPTADHHHIHERRTDVWI